MALGPLPHFNALIDTMNKDKMHLDLSPLRVAIFTHSNYNKL